MKRRAQIGRWFPLALAALQLCLCVDASRADVATPGRGPHQPKGALTTISAAELLAAPFAVDIHGRSVGVVAYLWRNFAPHFADSVGPTDGLLAAIRLSKKSAKASNASIELDRLWAIQNGKIVWESPLTDSHRQSVKQWRSEEEGPRLPPGSSVDVVVRVRFVGASYLVRAPAARVDTTQ